MKVQLKRGHRHLDRRIRLGFDAGQRQTYFRAHALQQEQGSMLNRCRFCFTRERLEQRPQPVVDQSRCRHVVASGR